MARSQGFCVAITVVSLFALSGTSVAADPPSASTATDAASIYKSFLSHWGGNVSEFADVPDAESSRQFTECASEAGSKAVHWAKATERLDLRQVIGKMEGVRFIDAKLWHPQDPGALMAKGESVGSAVRTGVSGGLMTLSAITFDQTYQTAAFTYSFVCGLLCGNGGIVIFQKTSKGWVQYGRSCGGWQS